MKRSIPFTRAWFRPVLSSLALVLAACNSSGGHHGDDNTAPKAMADSAATLDLSPVTIDVLANDTDPQSDTLTISTVGAATYGSAAISEGKIIYTPTTAFSGDDSFSYGLSDGSGGHTVQGQVTVHRSNSPLATNDEAALSSLSAVSVSVLANDHDLDGDSLSLTDVGTSDYATLTISGNKIVYTPTKTLSGDDHVSYTIADAAGHTATAQLTIHANNALHLQGKVALSSVSPLVNASVTVAVGAINSNATTKADGSFDIALSGLSTVDAGLVTVIASGADALSPIKLAAYIGDYAELYKQGGSAHAVDSDHNSMLNVTPMSTAWVANLDVVNGSMVSDNVTFMRLLGEVSTSNVYQTAALIKVAAGAIKSKTVGLQLPDGVSDTLALVRNPASTTRYFGQVMQHDYGTGHSSIADAKQAIIADPMTTMSIDAAAVAGQYYLNSGEIVSLQNANVGYVTWGETFDVWPTNATAVGVHWNVADSVATLTANSSKLIVSSSVYESSVSSYVNEQRYLTAIDLRVLAKFNGRLIFSRANHYHVVVPDHRIPDFDEVRSGTSIVGVTPSATIALSDAEIPGTWYLPAILLHTALPSSLTDNSGGVHSYIKTKDGSTTGFVFNADHTVTMPQVASYASNRWASSGTWSVDAHGILQISFTDPSNDHVINLLYTRLSAVGNAGQFSLKYIDTVTKGTASTVSEGGRVNANAAWVDAEVPGIYTVDNDALIGLNHFWIELNQDHTGKYVSAYDYDDDGNLSGYDFFINSVTWKVNPDGTLDITRYRDTNTYGFCTPSIFSPTCVVYQPRTLTALERAGSRVYFQRDYQANYLFDYSSGFIPTYEFEDAYHWTKVAARPVPLPAMLANLKGKAMKTGKNNKTLDMESTR